MVPAPESSSTLSDTIDTPGAIPAYFAFVVPVPPMMPATCVP